MMTRLFTVLGAVLLISLLFGLRLPDTGGRVFVGEINKDTTLPAEFQVNVKNIHPGPWTFYYSLPHEQEELDNEIGNHNARVWMKNLGNSPVILGAIWRERFEIMPGEKIELFDDSIDFFLREYRFRRFSVWSSGGRRLRLRLIIDHDGGDFPRPVQFRLERPFTFF
jgi:hypothetical protein